MSADPKDPSVALVTNPVLAVLRKNGELIKSICRGVLNEDRVRDMLQAAIRLSPGILDCSPLSVLNSVVYITYLGLEVGPESAYILPFRSKKDGGKKVAAPVIDYRSKIRLGADAGILFDDPEVVYAADGFRRWTDEKGKHFLHEPKEVNDRGEAIGVYVGVRWSGEYRITYMPAAEVLAIKAGALGRTGNSGPWVEHEMRMWAKTVIHRAFKTLPRPTDPHLAEVIRRSQEIDSANDAGEPVENLLAGSFEDEQPIIPGGSPEAQENVARQKIDDLSSNRESAVLRPQQPGKGLAPETPVAGDGGQSGETDTLSQTAAKYEREVQENLAKAQSAGQRQPLRFGKR